MPVAAAGTTPPSELRKTSAGPKGAAAQAPPPSAPWSPRSSSSATTATKPTAILPTSSRSHARTSLLASSSRTRPLITPPGVHLAQHLRPPGLNRLQRPASPQSQVRVEEIRVEVARSKATGGLAPERDRSVPTGRRQEPRPTRRASPRRGSRRPFPSRRRVRPTFQKRDPGPTPSALDSRALALRSTRVARPTSFRTVSGRARLLGESPRAPAPLRGQLPNPPATLTWEHSTDSERCSDQGTSAGSSRALAVRGLRAHAFRSAASAIAS